VTERLAISWGAASLSVVATLAWLSALLVSCPRVDVESVTRAGVEISTPVPSPGPRMVAIEVNDSEDLEDDLDPCGLPGMRLLLPPPLSLSQITPERKVSLLSALTPALRSLRC